VAKYGLAALVVGGAAVGQRSWDLFSALAVFLKKLEAVVIAFAQCTAIKKSSADFGASASRE